MKREMFCLHSILPPAELRDKLDLEIRVQNNLQTGSKSTGWIMRAAPGCMALWARDTSGSL